MNVSDRGPRARGTLARERVGNGATLAAMRACGLVVLAACGADPSLDISVRHPDGYRLTQTVVTVYAGDSIDCEEIAFGDRTDTELAAITVDEVDVTRGGRVEVSRLGGKSIVARGFGDQHRFLTAGCRDVGEITSGTELVIETTPTSVIAIDPAQPDRPFSERTIVVNMTDPNGVARDGLVSWQLTGPAGAIDLPPAAGVTTMNGDATFSVADLGTPGPEALRIRVAWATSPLPLLTAFDLSGATTIPLPGGAGGPITGTGAGHPSCDVRGRADQLPTLVCLTAANAADHRDAVEIAWQTDHYEVTTIPIPGGLDNQFALFVDHDGSAFEPVYVLAANAAGVGSWYKLGAPSGTPVVFEAALQNVVYVPRCRGGATAAIVGVQTGVATLVNRRRFYSTAGVAGVPAVEGEVFSAGCLADTDRNEHQAVVASLGAGDATLALITPTGPVPIAETKLNGSGFVSVETQGVVERRFAGTRLQATGTVVFEAVLAPEGSSYKLVERTELEAAAPPGKILGGKLDLDDDTDLMWDLATGLRRRVHQVSLARQVSGVPLTAMTSGPVPAPVASDFVIGNLDGGRADEMIVFTQSSVTIYSAD
jgi:hypothetical protein